MAQKYVLHALDLMTTADVAREFGVSVRTVQLWVDHGILEAFKTPGGHRRIKRESFNRLAKSRKRIGSLGVTESGSLKVVIVEDDSLLLRVYRQTIDAWRFPISLECFGNAVDALISMSNSPPDVLLTDLSMPEMDGFSLIESIRRTDIFTRMAIIVVTGLDVQEIRIRGDLPKEVRLFMTPPDPFLEIKVLMQSLISNKHALSTY